jgi:hypothetical protein
MKKLTLDQQKEFDALTSDEQKIYTSVLKSFPATSHESALNAAWQGGLNFQYTPR